MIWRRRDRRRGHRHAATTSRRPRASAGLERRAASLADRAGRFGRRRPACSPPTRPPAASRWSTSRTAGCCTSSRPARSRPAWPSRATAAAGWSPTGMATTWRFSTSRTTSSRSSARIEVGPEPRGVAMTADGSTAYVAVGVSNEVVRVDLEVQKVTGRLAGRPRAPRRRPLARRVAAARRQRAVAGRLARRRPELEGRARPSRSTATTCGRSRSAPTARRATSPT